MAATLDTHRGQRAVSALHASSETVRWTIEDVQEIIEAYPIVVFVKGSKQQPLCGFSQEIVAALEESGEAFEAIDVSHNRSIVTALRAMERRKFVPLVYVRGVLLSSSDTQLRDIRSGLFKERLKALLAGA